MKKGLLILSLSASLFAGSESIGSILNELNRVKKSYEECKIKLDDQSSIVALELQKVRNDELVNLKNQLKQKDDEIAELQKNMAVLMKDTDEVHNGSTKVVEKIVYKEKECKCEKSEVMPKLLAKEPAKISAPKSIDATLDTFEPTSFKLTAATDIFDSPNGKVVVGWAANRSFTANTKKGGWIKISGYFVSGKWVVAEQDMWIEEKFILKK
jgi:hypothetical protein